MGSASPVPVPLGSYSLPENSSFALVRTAAAVCVGGEYCINGLRYKCIGGTYSGDLGRSVPCNTSCVAGP